MIRAATRAALATYWPALTWMLVIFALSSVPGRPLPGESDVYGLFVWIPPNLQNLLHVPVFGLLAWLWQQALLGRGFRFWPASLAALVLTVGYGVLDEWHQSFVFGRYASSTDVALDTAGAVAAILLVRLMHGPGSRGAG